MHARTRGARDNIWNDAVKVRKIEVAVAIGKSGHIVGITEAAEVCKRGYYCYHIYRIEVSDIQFFFSGYRPTCSQ